MVETENSDSASPSSHAKPQQTTETSKQSKGRRKKEEHGHDGSIGHTPSPLLYFLTFGRQVFAQIKYRQQIPNDDKYNTSPPCKGITDKLFHSCLPLSFKVSSCREDTQRYRKVTRQNQGRKKHHVQRLRVCGHWNSVKRLYQQ